MSDPKDILRRADHALERVPLPPDGMSKLAHRRDRKRRNQRLRAGLLAMTIAVVSVAGVVIAFRAARLTRPASATEINRSNAGRLRVAWRALPGTPMSFPTSADGIVYAGSENATSSVRNGTDRLYAFRESCGTGGQICSPLWSAVTGDVATPTVADGVVYVINEGQQGHLRAFDAMCATGGRMCQPRWSADTEGVDNPSMQPVVADGTVYVATRAGRLEAFSASCGSGGATCTPAWTASLGGSSALAASIADGTLYVGTTSRLYAFSPSCPRKTCSALWSKPLGHVLNIVASNGVIYVGTCAQCTHSSGPDLFAFSTSCGSGSCRPLWTGNTPCCTFPAVGEGTVFAPDQMKGLYAFEAACGTGGATCKASWFAPLQAPAISATVANDVVYVGTQHGTIVAFSATCRKACHPLWTGIAGGTSDWTYQNATGTMVFGAGDGLVAFALPKT